MPASAGSEAAAPASAIADARSSTGFTTMSDDMPSASDVTEVRLARAAVAAAAALAPRAAQGHRHASMGVRVSGQIAIVSSTTSTMA